MSLNYSSLNWPWMASARCVSTMRSLITLLCDPDLHVQAKISLTAVATMFVCVEGCVCACVSENDMTPMPMVMHRLVLFWSVVPGIGEGGASRWGGESEPPTGTDEDEWANKTWRNCFCKEGGWMLYGDIVLRAAKGAGWFIVPAADSHRFTSPPSLLIHTDPSVFNYSPQPPPFSHPCPY